MIQAALKFRIELQAGQVPPDEDWLVQRFPYWQDTYDIEYSGFFRLLSAVAQSKGQRAVHSLVGFPLKQIDQQKYVRGKNMPRLPVCRSDA